MIDQQPQFFKTGTILTLHYTYLFIYVIICLFNDVAASTYYGNNTILSGSAHLTLQ